MIWNRLVWCECVRMSLCMYWLIQINKRRKYGGGIKWNEIATITHKPERQIVNKSRSHWSSHSYIAHQLFSIQLDCFLFFHQLFCCSFFIQICWTSVPRFLYAERWTQQRNKINEHSNIYEHETALRMVHAWCKS